MVRVATYSGSAASPTPGTGFLNAAGVLADPATVVLKLLDPSTGTTTTPAAVKDGIGLYHFDVDTTGKPGVWAYEWIGTGAVQAIQASEFRVQPAPL